MKDRLSLVLWGLLGIVAVFGGVVAWKILSPNQVILEVAGTPGTRLGGQVERGRGTETFKGPIPNTISARARKVSYVIENVGDPGTVTVRLLVNGRLQDTTTVEEGHRLIGTIEGISSIQRIERKSNK